MLRESRKETLKRNFFLPLQGPREKDFSLGNYVQWEPKNGHRPDSVPKWEGLKQRGGDVEGDSVNQGGSPTRQFPGRLTSGP